MTFLVVMPVAEASSVQAQPPEKIFAAICSTCHGADGSGGVSWIDGKTAPRVAGADRLRVMMAVRKGITRSMPGFAPDQITNDELRALAEFLASNTEQVPAPAPPAGAPVVLDILDADPWYRDDGTDLFPDTRRVVLGANQYLKVVNTGKTWHTITADDEGKDSGFIGYNQYPETGYYFADPKKDLAPGCVPYHCHLHPYMQTEICTAGSSPRPLTKAHKNPLDRPGVSGVDEIWLNAQTQEEDESDPVDGAMQVIDANTWSVSGYIPNVGNNPHSAWIGKDAAGKDVVLTPSWHDNIVTLIDADQKQIIVEAPSGAAAAHAQVSPLDGKTWVVTHHGGANAVEKIDVNKLEARQEQMVGQFDAPLWDEQSGPHGMWFCDDGKHFIVSNSFSNTVSLYNLDSNSQQSWAPTGGKFALNPSVMHGEANGCKRGYTTNTESNSVSVFDINVADGQISRRRLEGSLADGNGNLALSDTSASPVRWASYPIQSPISPPDSTTHGRYMVISNKESFNVSIAKLDAEGIPAAIYNFPAGLGGHGVSFGRKKVCDSGRSEDVCYFAYVSYTFEDYLGVYDLEKIENGQMGDAGSAQETIRLEGALADVLSENLRLDHSSLPVGDAGIVLDGVPITVMCPDCRSGVHVGDVPLHLTTTGKSAYLKENLWVDDTKLGGSLNQALELDLDVATNTGGFGVLVRPGVLPW